MGNYLQTLSYTNKPDYSDIYYSLSTLKNYHA